MSCICEPCKDKFTIGCSGEFEIRESECVYPDSYMVDFNPRINPRCNTIFEFLCNPGGIGISPGCIRYCDRDARLQSQMSGTFIVQRITNCADIADTTYGGPITCLYNTYQYQLITPGINAGCLGSTVDINTPYYVIIIFQILKSTQPLPIPNPLSPCGAYARATFYFPSYKRPCDPTIAYLHSTGVDGASFEYRSYTFPETCTSPISLSLFNEVVDPCYIIPMSVGFTPIIES